MTTNNAAGTIESRKDFENTPEGQYKYWELELKASFKRTDKWHKQADMIQRRYIDDRKSGADTTGDDKVAAGGKFRLNVFHTNAKTIMDMLYGKRNQYHVRLPPNITRKWPLLMKH